MELYSYVPTPGTNIPISVENLPVDDSVPTEDEREWEVIRLQNHCSGGPSGMLAEHLTRCLEAARKVEKDATTTAGVETTENKGTTASHTATETIEAANWELLVDLVQSEFREGKMEEEAMCQAAVLI